MISPNTTRADYFIDPFTRAVVSGVHERAASSRPSVRPSLFLLSHGLQKNISFLSAPCVHAYHHYNIRTARVLVLDNGFYINDDKTRRFITIIIHTVPPVAVQGAPQYDRAGGGGGDGHLSAAPVTFVLHDAFIIYARSFDRGGGGTCGYCFYLSA